MAATTTTSDVQDAAAKAADLLREAAASNATVAACVAELDRLSEPRDDNGEDRDALAESLTKIDGELAFIAKSEPGMREPWEKAKRVLEDEYQLQHSGGYRRSQMEAGRRLVA